MQPFSVRNFPFKPNKIRKKIGSDHPTGIHCQHDVKVLVTNEISHYGLTGKCVNELRQNKYCMECRVQGKKRVGLTEKFRQILHPWTQEVDIDRDIGVRFWFSIKAKLCLTIPHIGSLIQLPKVGPLRFQEGRGSSSSRQFWKLRR